MGRYRSFAITMAGMLLTSLAIQACAPAETRDPRERELASEVEQCPPGRIRTCSARATGRISDGRFGRRRNEMEFCTCELESDLDDLRGPDLPADPPSF